MINNYIDTEWMKEMIINIMVTANSVFDPSCYGIM